METSTKADNKNFVKDEKVESLTNQEELTCKIKNIIYELEMSQFYHDFHDEIQRKPISKGIQRVLRSEPTMQMVIYGIGNIKSDKDDTPKLQLSLAILMKKAFSWIGDIQVFDPILSTIEIQVLESLGCTVLSINEHGRRQAHKPTIFFMPHCDVQLYNNLLEANWEPNLLSNVIIFGNSFDTYIKDLDLLNFSRRFSSNGMERRLSYTWETMGHILAARTFTNEFQMTTLSDDPDQFASRLYWSSFSNLAWHFFSSLTVRKMRLMREITMKKHGVLIRRPEKKQNPAVTTNTSPKDLMVIGC